MDIQKDIEKYRQLGCEILLDGLTKEKEELRVKIYLFTVIQKVNQLDEKINEGLFLNAGIHYMKFTQDYDHDIGQVLNNIEILDKDKNQMNKYSFGNYIPEYDFIYELYSHSRFKLEDDLYNSDIDKKTFVLKLDEHAKERMKNYLLNQELRKAYGYIELLEKLPEKTNTTPKKKI